MEPTNKVFSYVQFEFYVFNPGQQVFCPGHVVFIDMHIAKIKRNGFEGQVYPPCHQIKMIDVGRKAEVGVRTALVRRYDQLTLVYLELHKAQAGRLVRFHACRSKEQHIVLAAAPFPVYSFYKGRQLLHVGRVAVHQRMAAVVPPRYAGLPVSFNAAFALHEQAEFVLQLFPGDAVSLEYVEQVGRVECKMLVEQVADAPFSVRLRFSF